MSAYSTKDAFDIYVYYLALKRHFTSSYDFFKYNGKVKANSHSFENRKDKFFFYRLSKTPEARNLILANMIEDPNIWAGDLLENNALETYQRWNKKQQTLGYVFRTEIAELDPDDPNADLLTDGDHPKLLRTYISNSISIETLSILNDLMNFFPYWEKKISDRILFPDINNRVRKYSPFLQYDKSKMRKILLDKYSNIH